MEKEEERAFLDVFGAALLSLPQDLKALAEAVEDPDLQPGVQELAAATVIHVLTKKDGHFEPILRYAEDVVLVRLAFRRIVKEGGDDAETFKVRFAETYEHLDSDIARLGALLGSDFITWMDERWDALKKAPHSRKTARQFVEDDALGGELYDEVSEFVTDYPVTDQSLEGRLKQAQPLVEHLMRKRELDKMKIDH